LQEFNRRLLTEANSCTSATLLLPTNQPPRGDAKPPQSASTLWRDRQLRDYRKANGLCYNCGEKFEPGHNEVCSKKAKLAHNNAMVINDLDRELSDDMLNQLAIEDALPEQFC
jgi:hypothetical protein